MKRRPPVPRIEPAPGGTGRLVRYPDGRLTYISDPQQLAVTVDHEDGLRIRVTASPKAPRASES